MPILVDSNVILDVVNQDPVWEPWSSAALTQNAGQICLVNPIIYAELCGNTNSAQEVDAVLNALNLRYQEIPREALFLAAQAHLAYRRRGGTRSTGLPDFFVGSHAQAAGFPIMTRDRGRYQTYFPSVALIAP
jgi:predicted nucleic acid-binding protein